MSTIIGLFCESSLNGPRNVHGYYQDLCRQIVLGDELGYDFFATTQSYGLDFTDSTFSIVPDPLALFASQISTTQRIKVLTAIAIAPFHHPAIAVSDFALVDNLSNGRVMLGVGRGHPWLYDRLGMKQDESRARMREFLQMTRKILDDPNGRHTISGNFWTVEDFELLPQFVQKSPPVYVAVIGGPPSALEAAENRCGLLFPSYLGMAMEEVENVAKAYRERYRELWGSSGEYLLGIHVAAGSDSTRAQKIGAQSLAGQLKVFSRNILEMANKVGKQYPVYREIGDFFAKMSDPDTCAETVDREWPRYMAVWGDKNRCLDRFAELIERIKPDGLILNIDAGGIPQAEVETSMRYVSENILSDLRSMVEKVRIHRH